ncbi:MAG: hypothetical protein WC649_00130 [Desulfobacteria bacterium]
MDTKIEEMLIEAIFEVFEKMFYLSLEPLNADNNVTGNMSLQRIYELTGDNSFQVLESQLLTVLQSIEDMNEFNRILMERSINFVKNAANFLDSFAFNTKNRGVVLSKEA